MKKKLFIFFIVWVVVFILGYLFLYKKHNLTPSYCFNNEDKRVLIVSNNSCDLDTFLSGPSTLFFKQIQEKVNFQKSFVSLTRPKILLSFKKKISDKDLEKLLKKLKHKYNHKRIIYKMDNKWSCTFSDNYIFFFKGKLKENRSKLKFSTINSDFSILSTNNNQIESYLQSQNSLIKIYQNQFKTTFLNKNDYNKFSNIIPFGISNYQFFEKKYAFKKSVIDDQSILNKIVETGFVVFTFKGKEYLLSDVKNNIDPYVILDEEIGRKEIVSGLRKKYEHLFLTSETNELNNAFYVDFINGKLLFSNSLSDFDEVSNLISQKKTLNKNRKEKEFVFFGLPTKVVYRNSNKDEKMTIELHGDKFKETNIRKSIRESIQMTEFNSVKNISHIIGGKHAIYVFTDNELIEISEDKIIERIKFKGEIVGKPEVLIQSDKEKIVFTTSEKLYFLDQNFHNEQDFPIELKNSPQLAFLRAEGDLEKLLGYSKNGIFSISDLEGNLKKKIKIDLNNVTNPIVYFKADTWIGVVYNENKAQFIDLNGFKLINEINLKTDKTVFFTTNQHQGFFYIEKNKLFRNDFNGELKLCIRGSSNLKKIHFFSESQVVGVLSSKNLALFDAMGDCVLKMKLPTKNINNYQIVKSVNGESFIILTDDLTNDIYIYTFGGESILKSPIKGADSFYIDVEGRNFVIYTSLNNRLVKYIR